jgi:hypothetical protein
MNALGSIEVEGNETIGKALHTKVLWVPANQRDYAWEKKHVTDLFRDITEVITGPEEAFGEYFLGTIVVIKDPTADKKLFVVDGQQRMATSAILIAAIRDYVLVHGTNTRAQALETRFLLSADENLDDVSAHLHLNAGDQDYFLRRVLLRETDERRRQVAPGRPSHKLIEQAAIIAKEHVAKMATLVAPEKRITQVLRWSNFLYANARVIWVTVPDDRAAYIVFETMNDRGLELSATDLIKNYLFGKAGAQTGEYFEQVKQQWNAMVSVIEGSREPDILKDYVRHYWIAFHQHTRTQELFNRVKLHVTSPTLAAQTTANLLDAAATYITLLNPMHPDWSKFQSPRTQRNVQTLYELGMQQIRPLLLAILKKFSNGDVIDSFRLAVSWVVRFLITGEAGSGALESYYGDAAREITKGTIVSTKQLALKMIGIVPQDDQFEGIFSKATVSKPDLARYYLRALELTKRNEKEPENIPNDDGQVITLEHVLPEKAGLGWEHFTKEQHDQYWRRIGNQALLTKTTNNNIGNVEFAIKKPALKAAGFELTQKIADKNSWTMDEINKRQEELAKLALKTWPLKI